jgi:hypothetical protein
MLDPDLYLNHVDAQHSSKQIQIKSLKKPFQARKSWKIALNPMITYTRTFQKQGYKECMLKERKRNQQISKPT